MKNIKFLGLELKSFGKIQKVYEYRLKKNTFFLYEFELGWCFHKKYSNKIEVIINSKKSIESVEMLLPSEIVSKQEVYFYKKIYFTTDELNYNKTLKEFSVNVNNIKKKIYNDYTKIVSIKNNKTNNVKEFEFIEDKKEYIHYKNIELNISFKIIK